MDIDIEKKEKRKEYYQKNKEKRKEYSRKYYRLNKEKKKEYDKKNSQAKVCAKRGITLDNYNKKLREQNCCCAICGRDESMLRRRLAIDHCHDSGQVRGLLCDECNAGIGFFKDSVELLQKAIEYLESI